MNKRKFLITFDEDEPVFKYEIEFNDEGIKQRYSLYEKALNLILGLDMYKGITVKEITKVLDNINENNNGQ